MTKQQTNAGSSEDSRSELNALLTAGAIYWWEQKRPVGWTVLQHTENPGVNCTTDADRKLAIFVSRFVISS